MSVELFYSEPGIALYCGDAREWLPTVESGSVDLVLTDPPYGIGYKPGGNGIAVRRVKETVHGDNEPFSPSHLLRFSRLILWGANHCADHLPASPSWLIWDKRCGTASDNHADCELAWTNLGGPARVYSQLWRGMLRQGEPEIRQHPTQKPVRLMKWCILLADGAECIADPYFGSGTTLVAAKLLGRRAVGCEIDPAYCAIAARRLRNTTPPLPRLLEPHAPEQAAQETLALEEVT